MKYTIEGFSQEYALKLRKEVDQKGKTKTIRIDCIDLLILRWFVDFYPRMVKTEIGGVQYAWVNYKELLEDMPILDMGRHSLAARLQKLVEFGILVHATLKTNGTFSYYGFGENYANLIGGKTREGVQQSVQGIQQTVHPLYSKVDTPYTANCTPNNSSTIYNSSTIDDRDIAQAASPPAQTPPRHKYGEYENVLLSDEEITKLRAEIPNVDSYIESLSAYIASKGAKYKSHYATIRNWYRKDMANKPKNAMPEPSEYVVDYERLRKEYL